MFDFKKYFDGKYGFLLKEVSYVPKEAKEKMSNVKTVVSDKLKTEVIGDELNIEFCRNISFEPGVMYNLDVKFEIVVRFKEEYKEEALDYDWESEFSKEDNPYLVNIICRASKLIADITSACGGRPLITPPVFIKE